MKNKIMEQLLTKVRQDLASAEAASADTSSYARDGDVKSDGKYDTRGIEAGYLASAQLKRVEELKLELQMLEETPLRKFAADDDVGLGALVDIALNGQTRRYFLASTAGGTILNVDGTIVLVISIFSPIGDAALGTRAGDEFELETPQGIRTYEVKSVS
jgi:transcription elongation GreA/GreB family factor